ncbi:GNAT family protein [Phycicoccus ginsengisoli]
MPSPAAMTEPAEDAPEPTHAGPGAGFANEHGQPVGRPVPGWVPRPPVEPVTLLGRTCRLEPARQHVEGLHRALDLESHPSTWAYYPQGPLADAGAMAAWVGSLDASPTAVPLAVLDPGGTALGIASYLRIDPPNGSVEVGGIVLSDALRRTTAATEAMYLMMRHAFDGLGYRRYEWKCDSTNEPSRRAAGRLGFSWEGTFRNAMVYRGRNRDTDWYSITGEEWPTVRAELERWLDPSNFDVDGAQRTRLDMAAALGHPPVRAPQDR